MGEQLHILIVDDNPDMADSLADILQVKGYDVHTTHSGPQALKVLDDHPIDILLTDVKMPGMNGVELYQAALETHPNLYTIFMTAYAADDLIKTGITLGVKTILTKPLNIKLLLIMFESIQKTLHQPADPDKRETPRFIKGW
jgi:CheY-like chemotaxis protein